MNLMALRRKKKPTPSARAEEQFRKDELYWRAQGFVLKGYKRIAHPIYYVGSVGPAGFVHGKMEPILEPLYEMGT